MLTNLASSAIFAFASDTIVNASAWALTLPACVSHYVVFAKGISLAFFAKCSYASMLADTAPTTVFASRLDAIVAAVLARFRAFSAVVFDLVVRADIWPLAFPANSRETAAKPY